MPVAAGKDSKLHLWQYWLLHGNMHYIWRFAKNFERSCFIEVCCLFHGYSEWILSYCTQFWYKDCSHGCAWCCNDGLGILDGDTQFVTGVVNLNFRCVKPQQKLWTYYVRANYLGRDAWLMTRHKKCVHNAVPGLIKLFLKYFCVWLHLNR